MTELVRDEDYLPDGEPVEVEGTPISRSEAGMLGLFAREGDAAAAPCSTVSPAGIKAAREPAVSISASLADKIRGAEKLLDAGNMEAALEMAQGAVREQPSSMEARLIIARAFMGLGEDAKALAILQGVSRAGDSAESLYYRGLASARLNRRDDALAFLQQSLSLPDNDQGRRESARALVERLSRSPDLNHASASGRFFWLGGVRPRPLPRLGRRRRAPFWPKALAVAAALAVVLIAALWLFGPDRSGRPSSPAGEAGSGSSSLPRSSSPDVSNR